jgi:hypothetical protein
MIDVLAVKQIDIVNILLLGHVFAIIEKRIGLLIYIPSVLISQSPFEIFVVYGSDYLIVNAVFAFVVDECLLTEGVFFLVLFFNWSHILIVFVVKVVVDLHILLVFELMAKPCEID